MSKLKPCPFCGNDTIHHIKDDIDRMCDLEGEYFCKSCLAKAPVSTWNNRVSDCIGLKDKNGEKN